MKKEIFNIILRRKNALYLPKNPRNLMIYDNIDVIITMMKNIESLGYTFSQDVIDRLQHYSSSQINTFWNNLIEQLQVMTGSDKIYNPMYPNFPKEVMEKDDVELYLNAIVHYLSEGTLIPNIEKKDRFPLIENFNLTVLTLYNDTEVHEMFTNLMQSKTSLSKQDYNDIEIYFKEYTVAAVVPNEIPYKETMAEVTKYILHYCPNSEELLTHYIHTATDVLRILTALSDGDVSLSNNTKYKSISRKYRRLFLSILNNLDDKQRIEDMYRYKNKWLRIGEILHPSEKQNKTRYTAVAYDFMRLRHDVKINTFNSRIEENLKYGNISEVIRLLKKRPTEFARRLSQLLNDSINPNQVLKDFETIADQVSFSVLLNLQKYFMSYQKNRYKLRVFFPKGQTSKIYAIKNNKRRLSEDLLADTIIVINKALFAQEKKITKLYIDDNMERYKIPTQQRNANSAIKTYTKGTRISINSDMTTFRPFIWWTNSKDRKKVDIDLSAVFYDKDWKTRGHCSWTNLRPHGTNTETFGKYDVLAVHSGDFIDGGSYNGNGVSEFIDMNFETLKNNKIRYVVITVQNYLNLPWKDIPCKFGWMERTNDTGEIFEPLTVKNLINITSETSTCVPIIIDIIANEIVWVDMSLVNKYIHVNTIETVQNSLSLIGQTLLDSEIPSMVSALRFRSEKITEHYKADYIFTDTPDKFQNLINTRLEYQKKNLNKPISERKEVIIPKIITPFDLEFISKLL